MVQRRVHNRFVRRYDPQLAARTGAYEGYPCGRCSLPILVYYERDEGGRRVHTDCSTAPAIEDLETYLLVQAVAGSGEDLEDALERIGEKELRRRAVAFQQSWSDAIAPLRSTGPTPPRSSSPPPSPPAPPPKPGPSTKRTSRPSCSDAGARVLDAFRSQLEEDHSTRARLKVRTTRSAAFEVILAASSRLIVCALPPHGDVGAFIVEVDARDRSAALSLLKR